MYAFPRRVHGLYNEEFFQQQKSREITEEILIKERGVIVGSAYLFLQFINSTYTILILSIIPNVIPAL